MVVEAQPWPEPSHKEVREGGKYYPDALHSHPLPPVGGAQAEAEGQEPLKSPPQGTGQDWEEVQKLGQRMTDLNDVPGT